VVFKEKVGKENKGMDTRFEEITAKNKKSGMIE